MPPLPRQRRRPDHRGCRRGECLGLQRADLDLDRSPAILGHQVVLLNGKIQIKERYKTKRNHLIRLDTGTVAMLRNWRIRQNEIRQLAGAGFKDQGFVFAQPDGGPFNPERFTRAH